MKQLVVYVENSVVGGYFDDEFKNPTQKLFNEFRNGRYKPVISSHVIAELENGAPEQVKENLKTIDYEEYTINEEMTKLAEKYMEQKIVSKNYYSDALHIAIATVIGVDVLVSWNFKHIVNRGCSKTSVFGETCFACPATYKNRSFVALGRKTARAGYKITDFGTGSILIK